MHAEQQVQFDLSGRVALITGASSGIGRATTLAFARAGAITVGTGLDTEQGAETVRLLEDVGGTGVFIEADVTDLDQVVAAVKATVDAYGRLDFAFNNAGISGSLGRVADLSESEWQRVIDVNLTGVWRSMRAELPVMLAQGCGAIVNCSSVLGLVAMAGSAAYVASKHGIIGLTKAAALEYAASGIRINAVSPGFVETPMIEQVIGSTAAAQAPLVALEPIGRLGQPDEIGRAVVWLCSDAASFVTGTSLVVDGGWIAGYRL